MCVCVGGGGGEGGGGEVHFFLAKKYDGKVEKGKINLKN